MDLILESNQKVKQKAFDLDNEVKELQEQLKQQGKRVKKLVQDNSVLNCKLEMRDIQMHSFISSNDRKSLKGDNLAKQF